MGAGNDEVIAEGCDWADRIVAGWGTHGAYLGRGAAVETLLRHSRRPVFHLGLTRDGQPRHPLYIAYVQQPEQWF